MEIVELFERAARRAGFTVRTIRGASKVHPNLLHTLKREVLARHAKAAKAHRNGRRKAVQA